MAWDNALKMQHSNNIYLFMADFSVKYVINIVKLEPIKASSGEGASVSVNYRTLQRQHLL